jgi:hypothetical protein
VVQSPAIAAYHLSQPSLNQINIRNFLSSNLVSALCSLLFYFFLQFGASGLVISVKPSLLSSISARWSKSEGGLSCNTIFYILLS